MPLFRTKETLSPKHWARLRRRAGELLGSREDRFVRQLLLHGFCNVEVNHLGHGCQRRNESGEKLAV